MSSIVLQPDYALCDWLQIELTLCLNIPVSIGFKVNLENIDNAGKEEDSEL